VSLCVCLTGEEIDGVIVAVAVAVAVVVVVVVDVDGGAE
jgi:hypothetical protein